VKLRYLGPHAEVEIAATGQTVKRGATVDVDTEIAKQLIAQKSWKKVTTTKKERPNG
jgi:hypothetical protein